MPLEFIEASTESLNFNFDSNELPLRPVSERIGFYNPKL